jgi:large subunit ribosomal protein L25
LIHADFYEIRMDRELTMDLPILLVGQPVGVERGGLLQQLKRDLKISGLPSALPESVELDVSGLDIGASVNVGDIVLGDGINILDGRDVAVASLISKRVAVMEEEAAEEGEAIEGEAAAGGEAEVSEGQGE